MKNNKLDLIIIGGGGNSQSIISFCKKIKTTNIIGYTDLINKGKILWQNQMKFSNK